MSKEKKPFLKKGSRQFLSNAQVRSQSTKPKVVEYADEDFPESPHMQFKPPKTEDDIQITVRRKSPTPKQINKYDKPDRSI